MNLSKETFKQWYAVLISIMFFVSMGCLFFITPPEKNRAIIDMCIGALVRDFIAIISHFFENKPVQNEQQD